MTKINLNEEAWKATEIEIFQTETFQDLTSVEKVLFAKWCKEALILYLVKLANKEKRDPDSPVH